MADFRFFFSFVSAHSFRYSCLEYTKDVKEDYLAPQATGVMLASFSTLISSLSFFSITIFLFFSLGMTRGNYIDQSDRCTFAAFTDG